MEYRGHYINNIKTERESEIKQAIDAYEDAFDAYTDALEASWDEEDAVASWHRAMTARHAFMDARDDLAKLKADSKAEYFAENPVPKQPLSFNEMLAAWK